MGPSPARQHTGTTPPASEDPPTSHQAHNGCRRPTLPPSGSRSCSSTRPARPSGGSPPPPTPHPAPPPGPSPSPASNSAPVAVAAPLSRLPDPPGSPAANAVTQPELTALITLVADHRNPYHPDPA